jgi:hypothetical protein
MNFNIIKKSIFFLISITLIFFIFCGNQEDDFIENNNQNNTTIDENETINSITINRFQIMRRASIVGETTATIDKSSPIWEIKEETTINDKIYKEAEYKFHSKSKTITEMDIQIYTEAGNDSISITRNIETDEYNVTYTQNDESADNIFLDTTNTYIINTNLFQSYEFALQSLQYKFEDKNLTTDSYTFLSFIPSLNEVFETQINKQYEEKLNINNNIIDSIVFEVSRAGDNQKIWLEKSSFRLIKLEVLEGDIEVRRVIEDEDDVINIQKPNLIKGERDFKALVSEPLLENEDTTDTIPYIDEELTEETDDDIPYIDTVEAENIDELYSDSLDEDSYFDEYTKIYELSISGITFGYNTYTIINSDTFYQVVEQTIMKLSKGPAVIQNNYNISYTWNKNDNRMLSYDGNIVYDNKNVLISLNENDDKYHLIRESENNRKQLNLSQSDLKETYFVMPYTVSHLEIMLNNINIHENKTQRINTVNPETNEKNLMVIHSTELLQGGSVDTDFAQFKVNATIGRKDYIIYLNEDDNSIYKIDYPSEKIVIRLSNKTSIDIESLNSKKILSNLYVEARGIEPGNVKISDYPDFEYLASVVRIEGKSPIDEQIDFYLDNRLQTFDGITNQTEIKGTVEIQSIDNTIYQSDNYPFAQIPESLTEYTLPVNDENNIVNIPSDNPKIITKAKEIVQGSNTVFEVTKKVCDWVFNNIEYELLGGEAVEVLESGEGDSGSKAQLTIAMLRSLGIPARVVGGLLYGNLYDNNFGQHYWVEVWIGQKGGWIMIDPTTGESDKFSPLHISLWRWENISPDEASYIDIAILERNSEQGAD